MARDESPYLSAILLCVGLGSLSSGCDGCGEAGRAARASVACAKACRAGVSVAPAADGEHCRGACLARVSGSGPNCELALVAWVECLARAATAPPTGLRDSGALPRGAPVEGDQKKEEAVLCAGLGEVARQCEAGCRAEGQLDVGSVVVAGNGRPRHVSFELLDCGCVPCAASSGAEPMSVCKSAKVCKPVFVACDGGAGRKLLRACTDGHCASSSDAQGLLGSISKGNQCTVERPHLTK